MSYICIHVYVYIYVYMWSIHIGVYVSKSINVNCTNYCDCGSYVWSSNSLFFFFFLVRWMEDGQTKIKEVINLSHYSDDIISLHKINLSFLFVFLLHANGHCKLPLAYFPKLTHLDRSDQAYSLEKMVFLHSQSTAPFQ